MRTGRTILLFTRAPYAEARAKHLHLADGARLFTGLLKGWKERAAEAGADLVIVAPEPCVPSLQRLLPGAEITTQQGCSFGARVDSAFTFAFLRGSSSVLMVGGDTPPLSLSDLHQAFTHLELHHRALVLTPAEDGGVNALGLNASAERPLQGVEWQSSKVCDQLLSAAHELDLTPLITAPGRDLDSASNVLNLYRLARLGSLWTAFRWLLRSLLVASPIDSTISNPISRLTADSLTNRGPPVLPASN